MSLDDPIDPPDAVPLRRATDADWRAWSEADPSGALGRIYDACGRHLASVHGESVTGRRHDCRCPGCKLARDIRAEIEGMEVLP